MIFIIFWLPFSIISVILFYPKNKPISYEYKDEYLQKGIRSLVLAALFILIEIGIFFTTSSMTSTIMKTNVYGGAAIMLINIIFFLPLCVSLGSAFILRSTRFFVLYSESKKISTESFYKIHQE